MAHTAFPLQPFMAYKIKKNPPSDLMHKPTQFLSLSNWGITKEHSKLVPLLWFFFPSYCMLFTSTPVLALLVVASVHACGSEQPLNQLVRFYIGWGRRGNKETKSQHDFYKFNLITRCTWLLIKQCITYRWKLTEDLSFPLSLWYKTDKKIYLCNS